MKVLRTALFSAFLMICFAQIGYAQSIQIQNLRATKTDNNQLLVEYRVIASAQPSIQLNALTLLPLPPSSVQIFEIVAFNPVDFGRPSAFELSDTVPMPANFPKEFELECVACVTLPRMGTQCASDCVVVGGKGSQVE